MHITVLSTRYVPLKPSPTASNIQCTENTVVFQLSIFQYVGLAVALSTAAPYRKPLFTNCKSAWLDDFTHVKFPDLIKPSCSAHWLKYLCHVIGQCGSYVRRWREVLQTDAMSTCIAH